MKSMTGFGRGEAVSPDGKIAFRTEISSVNRKQLEIKLNLLREMGTAEMEVRHLIASRISRGALSVRIETVLQNDSSDICINKANLQSLIAQLKEVDPAHKPQMELLLNIPGIMEQTSIDFEAPAILETLKKSCSAALDQLITMRTTEGENLCRTFEKQLDFLENSIQKIEPMTKDIPKIQQEKLMKRLQDNGLIMDLNDDRVLRELVIFSDRSDVTEEITRLRSHFSHFRSFLADKEHALGRNMDFLLQEIFREINTLGNKAPAPEISPLIVQLKTEVEKIREQVQNIE